MNDTNTGLVPASQNDGSGTAMSLILDPVAMAQVTAIAELMASSKITVPKHLQGNSGDCMAIVLQSARWRMDPFAVAQKTHVSQSGALGYEAQLVNAVIVSCGSITGQPEFEFVGDWQKILGRVEERRSDKGGKYYVPGWAGKDEEGLGVIVTATLSGESKPRSITVMLAQCFPRFSTQWATDPQQQITYVGVRKFARRYAPGAVLGVYTKDELEAEQSEEIDVTPAAARPASEKKTPEPKWYPQDQFDKKFKAFKSGIEKGNNSAQDAFDFIESKGYTVTDEQRASIEAVKPPIQGTAETVDSAALITYAQLAEKLNSAKDVESLDLAADLIGEIGDPEQRAELGDIYNALRVKFES